MAKPRSPEIKGIDVYNAMHEKGDLDFHSLKESFGEGQSNLGWKERIVRNPDALKKEIYNLALKWAHERTKTKNEHTETRQNLERTLGQEKNETKNVPKGAIKTVSEFGPTYSKFLVKAFQPELQKLGENMATGDIAILVDGIGQNLYIVEKTSKNFKFITGFTISTGKKGLGGKGHDKRTPLGLFSVEHYVDGDLGEVISGGHTIGKKVKDVSTARDTRGKAKMTTAALHLKGEESGNKNASGYRVHGTNYESRLGEPASGGCVRTANLDMEIIFDYALKQKGRGTLYVYISGRNPFPESQRAEK